MNSLPFFSLFLAPFSFSLVLLSIALFRKSYSTLKLACVCFAVISIDYFLVDSLPLLINFSFLHWNWAGKLGEIIWSLIIIFLLKWATPANVGLINPRMKNMLLGASIGLVYTMIVMLTQQLPPKNMLNLETMLFQFTLPGLAEELFDRGILLALLNQHFGYRWKFLNVKWGVGAIIVTILFILGHILYVGKGEAHISIHLENLSFDLVFMSICLVYLREKTGSIWPGVLCHNIANGLQFFLSWIILR